MVQLALTWAYLIIFNMNIQQIFYFLIGFILTALIVVGINKLIKWLGKKPGDFQLLKHNQWIFLPTITLLTFATCFGILLYFYQIIFGKMLGM
jgi:hypothetical protein